MPKCRSGTHGKGRQTVEEGRTENGFYLKACSQPIWFHISSAVIRFGRLGRRRTVSPVVSPWQTIVPYCSWSRWSQSR